MITISKLMQEDVHTVGYLLFDAFESKFNIKWLNREKQVALFVEFWQTHFQFLSDVNYVVKEQDQIIASFSLHQHNAPPRPQKLLMDAALLRKTYGWAAVYYLKHMLRAFFNHELIAHECYLSHLAVAPEQRGKGVGKMVLSWLLDELKKDASNHYLRLYVSTKNQSAQRLYEKMGFEVLETQYSFKTHLFIKQGYWHFMQAKLQTHELNL